VAAFIGTFENKIDRKGRVSVPAPFRQVLAGQAFQGIVALCSLEVDAIEACSRDFVDRVMEGIGRRNLPSKDQNPLSVAIFGGSRQLPFDNEGRVVLTDKLLAHAKITDRAAFVGMGNYFQIWSPDDLDAYMEEARALAKSEAMSLPGLNSLGSGL